jgi:DNA-binding NtrC family response regulator
VLERATILAPHGTRVEAEQLFLAERDGASPELGLDAHGDLARGWQPGERLCESVLNGVFTLDEVESMLLETAVAKAKGNLSGAARLLGITRPQLAYRLKRMKEADKQEKVPAPEKRPAKNSVAA